jgi:hypothetical protein
MGSMHIQEEEYSETHPGTTSVIFSSLQVICTSFPLPTGKFFHFCQKGVTFFDTVTYSSKQTKVKPGNSRQITEQDKKKASRSHFMTIG